MKIKAKKEFGQNFLVDTNVLNVISNNINANSDDLIIEIGPGRGALTEYLVSKTKVLAFEIDKDLIPILTSKFNDNLEVINKDFLECNILEYINNYEYNNLYIVGNLPYYITTPILEHIIKSNLKETSVTIMVQLEVANRFCAKPKSKDFGFFTVYLQSYYDAVKIIEVDNTSFDPAPKVKSAVIKLTPKGDKNIPSEKFIAFLKECFKEKRKTLNNNLKNFTTLDVKEVLVELKLNPMSRAEELSVQNFYSLYGKLV